MNKAKNLSTFAFLIFGYLNLAAQEHTMPMKSDSTSHVMMTDTSFKWINAPAGLPAGIKVAILSGDPTKEGQFTVRLMIPANTEIKPHWHPTAENITVIKGSMYMGTQQEFNKDKATRLTEGNFAVMPARFVHYAFAKSAAIVQIHGTGPFSINYVNPSDDPRNKAK